LGCAVATRIELECCPRHRVVGIPPLKTAITFIYHSLKFADAKSILFLVDTKNLGEQAEQEFMVFTPDYDTGSSPNYTMYNV